MGGVRGEGGGGGGKTAFRLIYYYSTDWLDEEDLPVHLEGLRWMLYTRTLSGRSQVMRLVQEKAHP